MTLIINSKGASGLARGAKFSIVLILILLCCAMRGLYASKTITLPDVVKKPVIFLAHKNFFFIAERTTVHIFSFPGFNYVRSFGRKGRGPGEFRKIRSLNLDNNHLHFSSVMEINVFSIDGKFIKRLMTNQRVINFFPFKNKYVGWDCPVESGKKYIRARLFDSNLKEPVLLYKIPSFLQKNNKVPYLTYKDYTIVIDDKVYINTLEGKIDCFDIDGKKIKTIDPQIKAIPITKEYSEKIIQSYKNSKLGKMILQMHGDRLYMSTHCPYIFAMKGDQGNLLVITYEKKNGYRKVKVLDKDGGLITTRGMPLKSKTDGYSFPSVRTLYQDKLYQLADNYEEETWEIHVSPLVDWKDVK